MTSVAAATRSSSGVAAAGTATASDNKMHESGKRMRMVISEVWRILKL
jgi:hypothetical protein